MTNDEVKKKLVQYKGIAVRVRAVVNGKVELFDIKNIKYDARRDAVILDIGEVSK